MLVCDIRQRIVAERCLVLVYAIEATEMAQQAKKIVQSNGMQDRITVVHGRVEVSVHQLSTSHTYINSNVVPRAADRNDISV